jgi:phenylpropionate dioxygenase-like ring-hydroxylating dioxygenase large terminal subunit
MLSKSFLASSFYHDPEVHHWDCNFYAKQFWHPLLALSQLKQGESIGCTLLSQRIIITWPIGDRPRAFLNRCPHRGVAFRADSVSAKSCRRFVCPYHGWTYDLHGNLLAAARESEFDDNFDRKRWSLYELPCRIDGPLIWASLSDCALRLDEQLYLIHDLTGNEWNTPLQMIHHSRRHISCNWKIAHDNTLDDYHVAIAHPKTLHCEQGPVRNYVYRFSHYCNLLQTPFLGGGHFFTFGLPPWSHVLVWPDSRIALIEFLPDQPDCCVMQLRLFARQDSIDSTSASKWLTHLLCFLEEDRMLVESAQHGYDSEFTPGPPHRLEQRILHWQELYRQLFDSSEVTSALRSQEAISEFNN